MDLTLIIFILLLIAATIFSFSKRKLTIAGIIVANALAILIYCATGLSGVALLGTFFILGIAATAWNRKKQPVFYKKENEQRDALQVLANGGIAGIIAIVILLFPGYETILLLMMASAFSSAAADTVSSELGMVYGKCFVDITSFRKDSRGENGVISFEGTMAGIAASLMIAAIYFIAAEQSVSSLLIIIIAGTIGNLADSLLGATLERNNIIGNNAVNFLNTFIAAAAGGVMSY